ncbi:SsrA-binding protein SmpB [candidate division WOR-3 bacterium]|nr:SsrA-binding protein SmpB [candidate division WOR-3 bacterium]
MRVENRKARYEYNILEQYEAGIVLKGQEVKSIREGEVSLSDSFCRILENEIFLENMHISAYEKAREKLNPKRRRKLLLNRSEIHRLTGKVTERGFTLIPLSLYFNKRGKVKLQIALCSGKRKYEKREVIKKRDLEREMRSQATE